MGDVDSFQKLSRVYDTLMKSAKFTEAQNKEQKGDFVDCVGSIVAYCEKEGGKIPQYEIDVPYDIVDKIITDLKEYNKSLIYEDKALASEIERYLKNKEIQDQIVNRDEEDEEITNEDYVNYKNEIMRQQDEDKKIMYEEDDE